MAGCVALTDEVRPPIQEPALQFDERVVFCACVDVNGYLPTHNLKFGEPQGSDPVWNAAHCRNRRSEEHTSELQSLMRISYAVFCLKKKKKKQTITEQANKKERQNRNKNRKSKQKKVRD